MLVQVILKSFQSKWLQKYLLNRLHFTNISCTQKAIFQCPGGQSDLIEC